jgi:D-aspartate ligase
MNIFVLGCDDNGLSVVQSLSKNYDNIYLIDSTKNIGTKSKLGIFIKVENPMSNERKFIKKIISLGKNQNKGVLIPTGDEWAEAISKNRKLLNNFYICAPNYDLIKILLDKEKFSLWAKKNNFLTPNIWNLNQISSIKRRHFPIVLKCVSRRRVRNYFNFKPDIDLIDKYRFKVCNDKSDLEKHIQILKKGKIKILMQQFIRGDTSNMYSVAVVANKGKLTGIFYGRKLRGYPSKFGHFTFGKTLKVDSEIKKFAKRFVKKSQFDGIAEIELKKDKINNKKYVIEINPRSWSWNKAATLSGVNMPLIYCNNLISTKQKKIIYNNNNFFFIKFFKDLESRIYDKKNYLNFPYFQKSFYTYIKFVLDKKKVKISEQSDELLIKVFKFLEFLKNIIKFKINNLIGKIIYILKKI